jgi:hypothetical protein
MLNLVVTRRGIRPTTPGPQVKMNPGWNDDVKFLRGQDAE